MYLKDKKFYLMFLFCFLFLLPVILRLHSVFSFFKNSYGCKSFSNKSGRDCLFQTLIKAYCFHINFNINLFPPPIAV